MVAILEIQHAPAIRLFHQVRHHALPDPATLVLQQPPVARLGRSVDVVWHVLPAAPRVQDIQNPIEYFPLIFAGAAGAGKARHQTFEAIPLGIGEIGAIRFAWHVLHYSAPRISSATALL